MARIRSVRPEFCTDEVMAELTIPCELHYVKLWTHADDDGRGIDNAKLLKGQLWPLRDSVTPEMVEQWQCELHNKGRIARYTDGTKVYFQVLSFGKHQHPTRHVVSKLPNPSSCEMLVSTASALFEHTHGTPVVVVVDGDVEAPACLSTPVDKGSSVDKDRDAKNGELTVEESFSTARAALAATHPRRESA